MENKKNHKGWYEESFKLEVLRDYYEQGYSLAQAAKKWGLKHYTLLINWKELYPIDSKALSLSESTIDNYMSKDPNHPLPKEAAQAKRIKELEKALQMEKLRSRGYEIMIELAEKQEGIQIRKKHGAKQ